jgi:ketosteroid isomerase-like protein
MTGSGRDDERDDASSREALISVARAFLDAWNRGDLEGAMAHVAETCRYDESGGASHEGKDAVRRAFAPTFEGGFGRVRFDETSVACDQARRIVTLEWRCTLELRGARRGYLGVDVLELDARLRVVNKRTYAKARVVLLGPPGEDHG